MTLLEFQPSGGPSILPMRRSRLIGAFLVLVLHLALFALVVRSRDPVPLNPLLQNETIWILHPTQPRLVVRQSLLGHRRVRARRHGEIHTVAPWTAPQPLSLPQRSGLGLSLFACSPETLANLSEEERSYCANAPRMQALRRVVPSTVPEHAVEADRWAQSSAREHAPLDVPCVRIGQMVGGGPGRSGKGMMTDFVCAYHEWQNDFKPPEGR